MEDEARLTHLAIEGIDGCGKGSQVRLLTDHLSQRFEYVRKTSEPTEDTSLGRIIRDQFFEPSLTDDELNVLFAADRIVHKLGMIAYSKSRRVMVPPDESVFYVSDRSAWSAYAYHGVDNPVHEYLSPEMAIPDFTVIIDIPVEVALDRLQKRVGVSGCPVTPDRFENAERLTAAREAYLELARRNPKRIAVVDGTGSVYQVAHNVCTTVDEWLG